VPGRNASQRAEQRALREQMRGLGMSRAEIAAEMARRYKLRPRGAWRTAWGWTLPEAADRYNALRSRGQAQPVTALTASRLSEWENWPLSARRPPVTGLCLLAEMYQCAVLDLIDVADREELPADQLIALGKTGGSPPRPEHGQHQRQHIGWDHTPAAEDAAGAGESAHTSALPALSPRPDDRVRRPGFAELAGTMPDTVPGRPVDLEPLALVLAGHTADTASCWAVPGVAGLAAAADDTRRQYQACRYAGLIQHLPDLITQLHLACASLDGEDQLRAHALSADVHHVLAGLLLKLDDPGLACLAADRSMRAAIASEDPLAVGASARILTHTLMSTGHLAAAIATASRHAARLDRDVAARTPEALSVYGSLLLRGAIAAAQHDQRSTAFELLGEADDAARQLGADGNAPVDRFRPGQREDAPRQHLRRTRRCRNRNRYRPRNRPDHRGRHRKESEPAHRCRTRIPAMGAARTGVYRAPRRWGNRARGNHRTAIGTPAHPRPCQVGSAEHPGRNRAVRGPGRSHRVNDGPRARVLSVIVCGAGPATAIGTLVKLALNRGWSVQVIATPAALGFIDQAAIEGQTGNPVKSQYSSPGAPRSQVPDAIIVAPATYNTINKWAVGISDTYALGVLAEVTGLGIPVVVLPFVNSALAIRQPFRRSIDALRAEGVRILLGPGGVEPHPPRTGGDLIASYPWHLALDEAERMLTSRTADSTSDTE
jgi:Flavoprotein